MFVRMGTKRVKDLGSETLKARLKSARLERTAIALCDDSRGNNCTLKQIYSYESPLYSAMLIRPYKRFLGDVELTTDAIASSEQNPITVHVPNTGPMTGLLDNLPAPVKLSKSNSKTRKYAYTLEWILDDTSQGVPGTWVGVHSAKANAFVGSILDSRSLIGLLPEYDGYQKEVKFGSSRIDFQLNSKTGKPCLVEVKSVTMVDCDDQGHTVAVFPDTKSDRASRHVEELIQAVQSGSHHAALVFLVQRGDCSAFAPCYEKDPRYANLLMQAKEAGVRIIPIQCELQRRQEKDGRQGVDKPGSKVVNHGIEECSVVWRPTAPLPCILDFKRPPREP